jgi:hypothetical protein
MPNFLGWNVIIVLSLSSGRVLKCECNIRLLCRPRLKNFSLQFRKPDFFGFLFSFFSTFVLNYSYECSPLGVVFGKVLLRFSKVFLFEQRRWLTN